MLYDALIHVKICVNCCAEFSLGESIKLCFDECNEIFLVF